MARADTLDWNTRPATNLRTGGSDVAVINGVTITTTGSVAGAFDAAGPNTLAIEPASASNGTVGYVNSSFNAATDDGSVSQTTRIVFSEPVYNLSVVVGDIDGGPNFLSGTAAFNDIVEFRANSGTVLPSTGTPVNPTKVTWTAATGQASANGFNVTDNSGDVTVTFAGPVTDITIRHIAGPNSNVTNPTLEFTYIETVNYTRSPRVTLSKISNGGVGLFSFSGTNGFGTDTITTATAGVGVAGTTKILAAASTATTLTENVPSGYIVTAASCSGLGSGGSATPNLTAGTILLDAAAVAPGANIACTYTDGKRPTVQVRKISNGAIGPFTYSGSNGFGSDTVTTTSSGVAASGAVKTLTAAATATTVTETVPAGYVLNAISCTGLGTGAATPNLATATVTLNAAATAANNNVVCTFTNTRTPTVKLQKSTTSGFGGPFTFAQGNLAATPGPISTVAAGTPTPAAPTAIAVTTIGSAVTLTETVAAGFSLTSAACTDANSAITGNSGAIGSLVGTTLTIPAGNVVAGADFTCVFTNLKLLPSYSVSKAQTSGPSPVVAAGNVISYTITVVNTGNQALTGLAIASDSMLTPVGTVLLTPAYASGDANSNSILDVGETWTYTVSYTVTQAVMDAGGNLSNSVSVTTNEAGLVRASSSTTAISVLPGLTVVKTASTAGPVSAGQVITYTYKIKNTGNITIQGVGVSETFNGYGTTPVPTGETLSLDAAPVGDSSNAPANNGVWEVLAPGDEVTMTAPYTVVQADLDHLQ